MSDIGQQLIDIVRAKAAEDPDFIYQPPDDGDGSCVYVHEGCPSCLLGHGLWDLGLIDASFERLRSTAFSNVSWVNEEGFEKVVEILDLDLDPAELVWLEAAQSAQDDRKTWRRAIELADEDVKEFNDDNHAA